MLSTSMNSDYLFVYGTLLKDLQHEMSKFLASHAVFIGKGYVYGRLYQISWFPGAIASNISSEKVYGSLFKVNDFRRVFKVLDKYEGVGKNFQKPNLFKRELVSVFFKDGTFYQTWVYFYNLPINDFKYISSGDFLKFSIAE